MSVLIDIFFTVFAWFTMGFISIKVWENYTSIDMDDRDTKFMMVLGSFITAPIMFAVAMAWIFANGAYKWFGGK